MTSDQLCTGRGPHSPLTPMCTCEHPKNKTVGIYKDPHESLFKVPCEEQAILLLLSYSIIQFIVNKTQFQSLEMHILRYAK